MKKDAKELIKVITFQLCYLHEHIPITVSVQYLGLNGFNPGHNCSQYAVAKPHIINFCLLKAAPSKLYNVCSPPDYPQLLDKNFF